PTSTTTVIDAGTLESFLFNAYAARKGGTQSTGNAVRGGYRGSPGIGSTNFYLLPGGKGPDEIVSGLREALYVTDLQGLHAAVNATTGDLSIPAKGIMIRGGEMAEPVQNMIIGGNLIDLLRGIEAVGSDLVWKSASGMIGVPTILTSPVKIGGRS
ncbi:metallopeptidase TldD-related protein, partial [Thermodesulfobacteriota bacterium]